VENVAPIKIEETMSLLSDKAKNTIKKEYHTKTRNNMRIKTITSFLY
jgi:hypothetical protein